MKNFIYRILKKYSVKILKKYKPKIIAITGSIGKTSTKEAIKTVLEKSFFVRASFHNFNNELGVPFTILGVDFSPGRSILKWCLVFYKIIKLSIFRDNDYPRVLILEFGADKPGDIRYLMEMTEPDIGVLTHISQSHLENFGNMDRLAKEKKRIVTMLSKDSVGIINIDNDLIKEMAPPKASVLTYGFSALADVRAIEITMANDKVSDGIHFKLVYRGSAIPVKISGVFGSQVISSALAATAVGISMGMNIVDISERLRDYRAPRGRMNLIQGIKNTILIDDTYNASPDSTINALNVLASFSCGNGGRKIVVLGDMLELGSFSEDGHTLVGCRVADIHCDFLITVGSLGKKIGRAAISQGMSESLVYSFDHSVEAGLFLQDRLKPFDVVLVKGSQGIRMERIVKEVMAEPDRAGDLLVRQDKSWNG